MIKIERDDNPSPRLLQEDISEFALDFLSSGTESLTIEYANGLTVEFKAD